MTKLIFVTSNPGKVESLRRRLDPKKYEIIQKDLDLPEIQATTASKIALNKAMYAHKLTGEAIIVQDSSFHINALNGFPGPYIKYINQTLGTNGLLKLTQGIKDRSCHFQQVLVYIDITGKPHVFQNINESGRLAAHAIDGSTTTAWSSLWNIYVPDGSDKPLAAFSDAELKARERIGGNNSEFNQFSQWLNKH